jgi:hypothetical protein
MLGEAKHRFDRFYASYAKGGENILVRPMDLPRGFLSKSPANHGPLKCCYSMVGDSRWRSSRGRHISARHRSGQKADLYSTSEVVHGQMRNPEFPPLYPDLSNICCLIFQGTSYHMRFSRTMCSVTRRGVEASFGESRSPCFEYISRVCKENAELTLKRGRSEPEQTCMVSKRISAWTTRRFPSFGPARPRCPSIARMLTIWGGVTSRFNVHLNRWFGDVLDLSKPCR